MLPAFNERKKLFDLFNFPIYADLGAAILALILLSFGSNLIGGLILVFVVFGSVLLHEIGHAIAVRKLGHGESTIQLSGLGGVTQWRGHPSKRHQIIISLAGPAVSFALAIIGFILLTLTSKDAALTRTFLGYVAYLNMLWAIFNILPIHPMDGGKALRAFLQEERRDGLLLSLKISLGTCIAFAILGFLQGYIIITLYLGYFAYQNWNEFERLR